MAAFAAERMPLRTATPNVVPNPVDTNHFRPMPEIAKDPLMVLCVGRIEPFKGSDILAEAMRLVWDSVPQARAFFAGGSNDWNRVWAEDFRAQWEGESRVVFLGPVDRDDLPSLYNRARVLTVPSRFESFGYTCAEGMSCGLPVVASDAGSLPELVEDGRDGLLFPSSDAERLADHIVALLRDGGLGRRLGAEAREKMVYHYGAPVIARKMYAEYEALLEPSV
jgi:glycosyltransferase involved in cell wall biosynthesis